MHLDKHPILQQVHDLCQAIEECGASEKLTRAVTMAGALGDAVEKLVDDLAGARGQADGYAAEYRKALARATTAETERAQAYQRNAELTATTTCPRCGGGGVIAYAKRGVSESDPVSELRAATQSASDALTDNGITEDARRALVEAREMIEHLKSRLEDVAASRHTHAARENALDIELRALRDMWNDPTACEAQVKTLRGRVSAGAPE